MSEFIERREQSGISVKLDLLHDDVSDMKSVLKDLTIAINRLAVVEERQTQAAAALERAFGALERVEGRLAVLELQGVSSKQTNDWMGKAVWAAVAAVAVFAGKKVGLL